VSEIGRALIPADWYEITDTGLVILRAPKIDEWLELGEKLAYIDGSLFYIWGDYLNEGERRYGEMYTQALDESGYKYQTLANAASVTRKIPREYVDPHTGEIKPLRRPARVVSPSVHRVLAKFSKGEDDRQGHGVIDEWLKVAETHNLGERAMRKLVKALPGPSIPDVLTPEQEVVLSEVGILDHVLEAPQDKDGRDEIEGPSEIISPTTAVEQVRERVRELELEVEGHKWAISDLMVCRRAMWARAWMRERGRRRRAEARVEELERRIGELEDMLVSEPF